MDYRRLGTSGLFISVVGLGGNTFGRFCDVKQTATVVHKAIDLGINFFDTADIYSRGVSEEYLGKAVAGHRHDVVIATKTGMRMAEGPNGLGLSRQRIIRALDDSLRRLGTDYVDLYYYHQPDPHTPIDETLRATDDLIRAGKIRYAAYSNYAGWQIAEGNEVAKANGYAMPVLDQSLYNVFQRGIETEVIPALEHYGMSLVPFSPLAGGFLTGKYQRGRAVPEGVRGSGDQGWQERQLTHENYDKLEALEGFAKERDHTVGELAVAWLTAHPVVCSVITGVTKPEQVEANAKAAEWHLTGDDLDEIDRRLG